MTQEEKAKRYEEALEELRGLLEGIREEKCKILEEDITSIFPELAGSEDERIRKRIIHALHGDVLDMEETNKAIAWLEKQGEKKPTNKVEPKFHEGQWIIGSATGNEPRQIAEITEEGYKTTYGGWIGFSFEDELYLWIIQDAKDGDILVYNNSIFIFNEIHKNCLIYYGIYENDKFHDDKCYSCLILDTIDINNIHPATKEQRDLLFQKMKEAGYEWDAEKKQLRKMEHDKSKFQILKDAWYVCTCTTCTEDSRIWFNNGTAYLGSEILKYDLGFEPEEYQNYFRLWTIKDAKDGDILASKSGDKIFSYRGNLDLRGNPCAYYGIYKVHDGICFSPCAIGNSFTHEEVFPATKEQRKILFEERTAAGGVLHFSKKELKKIEDEIEIPYGAKDSELQEDTYYIPKGFHAEIDDDKVVIKKGEKPTAWSEEDENIKEWIMSDINKLLALNRKSFVIADKEITWLKSLKGRVGCEANCTTTKEWSVEDMSKIQRICKYLDEAKKYYADITEVRECIDWLKFLRPQYTWQPSDEQMEVLLSEVKGWTKGCHKQIVLESLYNDLKKLK